MVATNLGPKEAETTMNKETTGKLNVKPRNVLQYLPVIFQVEFLIAGRKRKGSLLATKNHVLLGSLFFMAIVL